MSARILVVDDDKALSEMLGMVLQGEGFDTVFAADGPSAVERFREARPDLVLLDLMLPGIDGIEVCTRIRAESGVPIIMLTARTDTVDVVRGLEAGADDVVTADDGAIEVLTDPAAFEAVKAALERAGLQPELAEVTMRAENTVELAGDDAHYQVRDWANDEFGTSLGEWRATARAPLVILEGVTSTRRAARGLAYRIWVQAPDALRLTRGLRRDGDSHRQLWLDWMIAEREFFDRDGTKSLADLLVDGNPTAPHDPDVDVLLLNKMS